MAWLGDRRRIFLHNDMIYLGPAGRTGELRHEAKATARRRKQRQTANASCGAQRMLASSQCARMMPTFRTHREGQCAYRHERCNLCRDLLDSPFDLVVYNLDERVITELECRHRRACDDRRFGYCRRVQHGFADLVEAWRVSPYSRGQGSEPQDRLNGGPAEEATLS